MNHSRKARQSRRDYNSDRLITRKHKQEHDNGFKCSHCKQWVVINPFIGTANRNHCNLCLWSKHVDNKKGDRRAICQAGMRPVGITFRIENSNTRGEIMLIHACAGCPKLSINRIAGDDGEVQILELFGRSFDMSAELRGEIEKGGIYIASINDRRHILDQLYGMGYTESAIM